MPTTVTVRVGARLAGVAMDVCHMHGLLAASIDKRHSK